MNLKKILASTCLFAFLFSITGTSDAEARRRKRSRHGTLVIQSMTDGAKVYVDGKLKGKTPFEKPIRLRPGVHKLRATKAGFSTFEMKIKIRRRRKTEINVDLLPFSGLIKFTSNVDGAEVYVDNKMVGNTPLIRDVPVGTRKVVILKEGYNDFMAEITIKAGEKHFVEGVLTPFRDFSPEVLAIAEAEKKKAEQIEKDRVLQEKLAKPASQEAVAPAQPWYADLHKKWWVWAIAGAVVTTAITVPLVVTSGGKAPGLDDHIPAATIPLP